MSQLSFSDAEYAGKRKQTKREKFLAEMEQVVPWDALLALIEPVYPRAGNGRRPYLLATMLRVHLMQNWYGYSDPGMEEALYEVAPLRRFAGLSLSRGSVPDETTILNFRRLLEKHDLSAKVFATVNGYLGDKGMLLREGTIVDATIIHAPPSTKNKDHKRDPDMHQTRKGNQWYFGMKAHIGVDAESGLTHTLTTTAANVGDVVEIDKLLHGKEKAVYADAGYTGAEKRAPKRGRKWHIAAKRSKVKALPEGELKEATKELEHLKAAVRSKVEHVSASSSGSLVTRRCDSRGWPRTWRRSRCCWRWPTCTTLENGCLPQERCACDSGSHPAERPKGRKGRRGDLHPGHIGKLQRVIFAERLDGQTRLRCSEVPKLVTAMALLLNLIARRFRGHHLILNYLRQTVYCLM
jgi:IS5 family transposase